MYSIASWEVKCHVGTFLAGFLLDTAFGLSGICIKSDTLTLLLGPLCSVIDLSIHAGHGNRDGNRDTHKQTKHHFKILYLLPGKYIIIFFCSKLHLSNLKQKKKRIEQSKTTQMSNNEPSFAASSFLPSSTPCSWSRGFNTAATSTETLSNHLSGRKSGFSWKWDTSETALNQSASDTFRSTCISWCYFNCNCRGNHV